MLLISGHTPDDAGHDHNCFGTVGLGVSTDQAYQGARSIGLAILASAKAALGGDLSRIERLVEAVGVVACSHEFHDHPKVINGFSDLMRDVFGPELGVGIRSATGVISLPGHAAVEITKAVFLVKPAPQKLRPLRAKRTA
jgi:hypothetical protein